jgi:hypothetical protein
MAKAIPARCQLAKKRALLSCAAPQWREELSLRHREGDGRIGHRQQKYLLNEVGVWRSQQPSVATYAFSSRRLCSYVHSHAVADIV